MFAHRFGKSKFFVYTQFVVCIGLIASGLMVNIVQADSPKGYSFLSYNEGMENARKSGKRLFLYFGRYGCGYCDKTNRESFSNSKVRAAYSKNYELVYVDAESGNRIILPTGERITEMELGARLKVIGTPVFVFLEPDGKHIIKVPGFQTAEDFLSLYRYVSKGIYKKKTFAQFLSEAS